MTTNVPAADRRQLRSFALVVGGAFALVFGLLLPWLWSSPFPRWPWALFGLLASWAVIHPASLAPLHSGWMKLAEALGRINNRIILGVLFFVVITPVGLARRMLGRDAMARRLDPGAATYRKPKARRAPESLERPF